MVSLGSLGERLVQLGVEPDRLDAGSGGADRWAPAPAAERLVDVVAASALSASCSTSSLVIGLPLAVLP